MTPFSEWLIAPFVSPERHRFHRQLAWIQGDQSVCLKMMHFALTDLPEEVSFIWMGGTTEPLSGVPLSQYQRVLGREYDVVIFNAFSGFCPNAFLAVAGTLAWGGRLLLLTPPHDHWPVYEAGTSSHYVSFGYVPKKSLYIQELVKRLNDNQDIIPINAENTPENNALRSLLEVNEPPTLLTPPFLSHDQHAAFVNVKDAFERGMNCLLTGARGRGKSTLLALFILDALRQGGDVDLVSLHKSSVKTLLDYCHRQDDIKAKSSSSYIYSPTGAHLRWMTTDNKALTANYDIPLIVDEAAAIPLPVLLRIVKNRKWFLLCSTIEGYEGSSNGFSLRIQDALAAVIDKRPLSITLHTPIRWHKNDSLESSLRDVCTLSYPKGLVRNSIEPQADDGIYFEKGDNIDIAQATEVLSLLDAAHYQSSPKDIKRALDAPDLYWCFYMCHGQLLGAALITEEGGDKLSPIALPIVQGKRRVRGHLSAQMLAVSLQSPEAVSLRYWRIHRIAVQTAHRRQGIATLLIDAIVHQAKAQGVDSITTVYGETDTLSAFWDVQHFSLVKVGVKQNKASGQKSALRVRQIGGKSEI